MIDYEELNILGGTDEYLSHEDYLTGDDLAQYYIEQNGDMYNHDANLAFEQFKKDHDWLAMAEQIWSLYTSYIGLGTYYDKISEYGRYYNDNKKQSNRLLSYFFDRSFRILDDLPREKACSDLLNLKRRVESDRAVDVATSKGTSEAIQMYDFFLEKIDSELLFQQARAEEAPLLADVGAQPVGVDEKIQQAEYRESLQHKEEFNHAEAAVYLELTEQYLYRLTHNHIIKYFKQGKKNKYIKSVLDEWLKENRRDIRSRAEINSEAATYVALHKGSVKTKAAIYSKERNTQKEPVKLTAKKQEVKKVIPPIKWIQTEAFLQGVAAGLHKKGFISDEQSFMDQFYVIELAAGKEECHPAEWTGDKTALTYFFTELQKLGAVFQKIKIWETVGQHFTSEGKSINNLKQSKYGYSGGKPKAAHMIDEILAIIPPSK